MTELKRLHKRRAAYRSVHRLLKGKEGLLARDLAVWHGKHQEENVKLDNLQSYYDEYLESLRAVKGGQSTQVQARIRQQQFLARLQTVIGRQQADVQAHFAQTTKIAQAWSSARRRTATMEDQLNQAEQSIERLRMLTMERQAEEEAQQQRMFVRRRQAVDIPRRS